MAVSAKFYCESILDTGSDDKNSCWVEVKLRAVIDGLGNRSWSKWTPAGSLTLVITNPEAAKQFIPKKEYYLTIDQVQEAEINDSPSSVEN